MKWSTVSNTALPALVLVLLCGLSGYGGNQPAQGIISSVTDEKPGNLKGVSMLKEDVGRATRSDAEWKQILSPQEYRVTVEKDAERPFSSPLNDEKRDGVFACVRCDLPLFSSAAKYDSGTGWPSFYGPLDPGHIATAEDRSLFTVRTEVLCARCDSHLGHVFKDGPEPTGLRYCMNGVSLKFVPVDRAGGAGSDGDERGVSTLEAGTLRGSLENGECAAR